MSFAEALASHGKSDPANSHFLNWNFPGEVNFLQFFESSCTPAQNFHHRTFSVGAVSLIYTSGNFIACLYLTDVHENGKRKELFKDGPLIISRGCDGIPTKSVHSGRGVVMDCVGDFGRGWVCPA